MCFDELLMAFHTVCTDANHFIAHLGKFCIIVAQGAGFCRAPWGLIFGVEIEYYFATSIFASAHFFAVLIEA